MSAAISAASGVPNHSSGFSRYLAADVPAARARGQVKQSAMSINTRGCRAIMNSPSSSGLKDRLQILRVGREVLPDALVRHARPLQHEPAAPAHFIEHRLEPVHVDPAVLKPLAVRVGAVELGDAVAAER